MNNELQTEFKKHGLFWLITRFIGVALIGAFLYLCTITNELWNAIPLVLFIVFTMVMIFLPLTLMYKTAAKIKDMDFVVDWECSDADAT